METRLNDLLRVGSGLIPILLVLAACGGRSGSDLPDTSQDTGLEADPDLDALEESDPSGDPGDEEARVPADDFTLTDLNPLSPTFETERQVSDEVGKVLVVYFANYT